MRRLHVFSSHRNSDPPLSLSLSLSCSLLRVVCTASSTTARGQLEKLCLADGRALHDGEDPKLRAFACDWQQCMLKGDRFLKLFKKGASDDEDPAVADAKAVIAKHYRWLM